MSAISHIAVVPVLVLVAVNAWAQSSVYLVMPGVFGGTPHCVGRLFVVDVAARRLSPIADVPRSCEVRNDTPFATPDGRYLVWMASSGNLARDLTVFDTATGRWTTTTQSLERLPILGNPVHSELLTGDATSPLVLSAAGERRYACPACSGVARVLSLSANGRRVAYRAGPIVVFDTAFGTQVATLPLPGLAALSRNGADLFLVKGTNVERYDVATGVRLAAATVTSVPGQLHVDPRNGELFLIADTAIQVHDPESLQILRQAVPPWSRPDLHPSGPSWTFDPGRAMAYATSLHTGQDGETVQRYVALNTSTLQIEAQLESVLNAFALPGRFIAAAVPAVPTGLAATREGRSVELAWMPGGAAAAVTRYVLEAGSGPGLRDIFTGLDVGLQTSFSVSNVPPGRYYVRVRAGNYTGLSAPSNETVVQVP